jgi:hypothetical protein
MACDGAIETDIAHCGEGCAVAAAPVATVIATWNAGDAAETARYGVAAAHEHSWGFSWASPVGGFTDRIPTAGGNDKDCLVAEGAIASIPSNAPAGCKRSAAALTHDTPQMWGSPGLKRHASVSREGPCCLQRAGASIDAGPVYGSGNCERPIPVGCSPAQQLQAQTQEAAVDAGVGCYGHDTAPKLTSPVAVAPDPEPAVPCSAARGAWGLPLLSHAAKHSMAAAGAAGECVRSAGQPQTSLQACSDKALQACSDKGARSAGRQGTCNSGQGASSPETAKPSHLEETGQLAQLPSPPRVDIPHCHVLTRDGNWPEARRKPPLSAGTSHTGLCGTVTAPCRGHPEPHGGRWPHPGSQQPMSSEPARCVAWRGVPSWHDAGAVCIGPQASEHLAPGPS